MDLLVRLQALLTVVVLLMTPFKQVTLGAAIATSGSKTSASAVEADLETSTRQNATSAGASDVDASQLSRHGGSPGGHVLDKRASSFRFPITKSHVERFRQSANGHAFPASLENEISVALMDLASGGPSPSSSSSFEDYGPDNRGDPSSDPYYSPVWRDGGYGGRRPSKNWRNYDPSYLPASVGVVPAAPVQWAARFLGRPYDSWEPKSFGNGDDGKRKRSSSESEEEEEEASGENEDEGYPAPEKRHLGSLMKDEELFHGIAHLFAPKKYRKHGHAKRFLGSASAGAVRDSLLRQFYRPSHHGHHGGGGQPGDAGKQDQFAKRFHQEGDARHMLGEMKDDRFPAGRAPANPEDSVVDDVSSMLERNYDEDDDLVIPGPDKRHLSSALSSGYARPSAVWKRSAAATDDDDDDDDDKDGAFNDGGADDESNQQHSSRLPSSSGRNDYGSDGGDNSQRTRDKRHIGSIARMGYTPLVAGFGGQQPHSPSAMAGYRVGNNRFLVDSPFSSEFGASRSALDPASRAAGGRTLDDVIDDLAARGAASAEEDEREKADKVNKVLKRVLGLVQTWVKSMGKKYISQQQQDEAGDVEPAGNGDEAMYPTSDVVAPGGGVGGSTLPSSSTADGGIPSAYSAGGRGNDGNIVNNSPSSGADGADAASSPAASSSAAAGILDGNNGAPDGARIWGTEAKRYLIIPTKNRVVFSSFKPHRTQNKQLQQQQHQWQQEMQQQGRNDNRAFRIVPRW